MTKTNGNEQYEQYVIVSCFIRPRLNYVHSNKLEPVGDLYIKKGKQ